MVGRKKSFIFSYLKVNNQLAAVSQVILKHIRFLQLLTFYFSSLLIKVLLVFTTFNSLPFSFPIIFMDIPYLTILFNVWSESHWEKLIIYYSSNYY